ncbi:MAG: Na/Pi cotransporter family protein [Candidatus Omnitrophota bacterium]|jgi:phosphate:Na+ symporter|nr:MAG: Na/Pi cotransporter family protein [Candidatus Omnitrophota bacterium]
MRQLAEIKKDIAAMAGLALQMWQLTYRSFMDHDLDLLGNVLEKENQLNDLEKRLTQDLVGLARATGKKDEKHAVTVYADVVGDLELIGDYCKDILERVQIKVEEKLLFSDDAVKEYSELYRKTELALKEVGNALVEDNLALIKAVLKNEEHIDSLVDEYRRRHNQRLIDGVCSPLACNMFLNMLDFSAAVYYHTKKIARNLLKVKL